jgi:hypothetical protein
LANDFDSSTFAPSVDQFFTSNVTVDGQPLNLSTNPLTADLLQADIIDKLQSNGQAEQQILLPSIAGTNIDTRDRIRRTSPGGAHPPTRGRVSCRDGAS